MIQTKIHNNLIQHLPFTDGLHKFKVSLLSATQNPPNGKNSKKGDSLSKSENSCFLFIKLNKFYIYIFYIYILHIFKLRRHVFFLFLE